MPNTITFWHDLLGWFPNLKYKCDGYADYFILALKIESILNHPDYIIRNSSYLVPRRTGCPERRESPRGRFGGFLSQGLSRGLL